MSNTLYIASDHAGFALKAELIEFAQAQDLGTHSAERCDYPDFANALAERVLKENARGILICGSGIGMSIAANRHKGIRAALCTSGLEAELARKHNDANVLCLGARLIGIDTAKECVQRFLNTAFEGGRHAERVEKLE